jgi:hypothetical protein
MDARRPPSRVPLGAIVKDLERVALDKQREARRAGAPVDCARRAAAAAARGTWKGVRGVWIRPRSSRPRDPNRTPARAPAPPQFNALAKEQLQLSTRAAGLRLLVRQTEQLLLLACRTGSRAAEQLREQLLAELGGRPGAGGGAGGEGGAGGAGAADGAGAAGGDAPDVGWALEAAVAEAAALDLSPGSISARLQQHVRETTPLVM